LQPRPAPQRVKPRPDPESPAVGLRKIVAGVGDGERAVLLRRHLDQKRRPTMTAPAAAGAATATRRRTCGRRAGGGGSPGRGRAEAGARAGGAPRPGAPAGGAPAAGPPAGGGPAGGGPPGPIPRPAPGGAVITRASVSGSSMFAMNSPDGLYSIPPSYAQCSC